MSQAEVQRLNDQLSKNKSLQAKIDGAKAGEDLVAVAREAGFNVTDEDFQEYANSLELTSDELEQVSGGLGGDDDGSFRGVAQVGLNRKLLEQKGYQVGGTGGD
jgi:predicted ribosomally synthesized peptide with nif11-like leader